RRRRRPSILEVPELSAREIRESLLDFALGVHHEGAVLHYRLAQRFAVEHEQLSGGRGLDRDALTDRAKQDEVVRTCAGVVVDDEVAFHHEHRYRLMRGERKLD